MAAHGAEVVRFGRGIASLVPFLIPNNDGLDATSTALGCKGPLEEIIAPVKIASYNSGYGKHTSIFAASEETLGLHGKIGKSIDKTQTHQSQHSLKTPSLKASRFKVPAVKLKTCKEVVRTLREGTGRE